MPKPGIDDLLVASALDPGLRARLLESPDAVFENFELTDEEKDVLRRPDHRLLGLLGLALTRQSQAQLQAATEPAPAIPAQIFSLPDIDLVLTVAPFAQYENARFKGVNYTAWVTPLPPGGDPAGLPAPPGAAVLPGLPLPPLRAVIQVHAVQMPDAAGNPVVALSASLRQSSNVAAPAPPQMAGDPQEPPFGSDLRSEELRAAAAAVRRAPKDERYGRILDLLRALRTGEVR